MAWTCHLPPFPRGRTQVLLQLWGCRPRSHRGQALPRYLAPPHQIPREAAPRDDSCQYQPHPGCWDGLLDGLTQYLAVTPPRDSWGRGGEKQAGLPGSMRSPHTSRGKGGSAQRLGKEGGEWGSVGA